MLMSGEASDMSLLMVYATVSLLAGQLLLTVLFHRMPKPWSDKPAFLAHHTVSMCAVTFMAISGCREWFSGRLMASTSPEGRFWDLHPTGDMLAHFMFVHILVWDVPTRLIVASLRDPTMLAHHAGAALVAFSGLYAGPQTRLTYYSTYFFGVVELSSIPLHVMTLFKPGQILHTYLGRSPVCDVVNQVARATFSLVFLAVRAVHFPYITFCYALDAYHLLFVSKHPMTTAERVAMLTIAVCSWALMGLQLFWARIVANTIRKSIFGRGKAK